MRTLLALLRQKRYQTTTNYSLLMWNHRSPLLQLAIAWSTEVAIKIYAGDLLLNNSELPLLTDDIMDLLNLCLTSTFFQYNGKVHWQTVIWNSYGFSSFCCYSRNCNAKHRRTSPSDLHKSYNTSLVMLRYQQLLPRTLRKDRHLKSQNADKRLPRESDFLDETLTVTPVPTHRPTST